MAHLHDKDPQAIADALLRGAGLRVTDARTAALTAMLAAEAAVSQPDLERLLGADFDRVTIYRTLAALEEKGLIHKVPDDSGAAKYAACAGSCAHATSHKPHADDHVHFKCEDCGRTECLPDQQLPALSVPQGYDAREVRVLISGSCSRCRR